MAELNLQDAPVEQQLRVRASYESRGVNPPPAYRLTEIARRCNLPLEAVKTMAEQLSPAR